MNASHLDPFKNKHDARLVEALSSLLAIQGPIEVTAKFLSEQSLFPEERCLQLLEEVAANRILTKVERVACTKCDKNLSTEELQGEVCPYCQCPFEDVKPVAAVLFAREESRARDIIWVLTLHGMNTQGVWQEDLNWLVSRSYGRMVPVAIYKYGIVRPGAVLKFRQRILTRGLVSRIRRLTGETTAAGFGQIPDVIAHSFGTWLLGHALRANPTLQVGRVILTGCILRPDFEWEEMINRGQVQAVLCHVATKDFWAGISHFVIPDSGPSGRRGFNDRLNVLHAARSAGHSDFFKEKVMPELFAHVWQPFLTGTDGHGTAIDSGLPEPTWKQAWWPLRATIPRLFVLATLGILVVLVGTILALGILAFGALI
jgi:uncharacterized CHY-type Zn-finger protein